MGYQDGFDREAPSRFLEFTPRAFCAPTLGGGGGGAMGHPAWGNLGASCRRKRTLRKARLNRQMATRRVLSSLCQTSLGKSSGNHHGVLNVFLLCIYIYTYIYICVVVGVSMFKKKKKKKKSVYLVAVIIFCLFVCVSILGVVPQQMTNWTKKRETPPGPLL